MPLKTEKEEHVKNKQSKPGTNSKWEKPELIISKKPDLMTTIHLVGLLSTNSDNYWDKIEPLECCQDQDKSNHV